MLSKSFKAQKCKTSLKLAEARIKLLRNKRDVQVKSMKRELAQLLESGQEQTARIRVEHVIREEKTMSAYDLIELYCELIAARLPIIESQKSCPIDLKEAISSVIFASPRCADLPELMDIRKHFTAKYGKEFINSALEVRPDCGVSRLVVEKLSARAPDVDTKFKMLTSIAQEHNVKWDSKAFEEQLQKPSDDLLNGPSTFSSSSKMPKESSTVNYSQYANQTKESSTSQNAARASKPTSAGTFSYTNSRTSNTSPESRASEISAGGGVENSSSTKENVSSNRSTWNMEFKDATSAAQAAAESAERASMAARAAAEIASRENFSRQNPSGSNEPSTYSVKNERHDISRGSKLKGEDDAEDLWPKARGETENCWGMQPEMQNMPREVTQEVLRREIGETNDGHSSVRRAVSRSSSRSSETSVNDGFLNASSNITSVKDYDHALKMSSASETRGHNHKNVKHENAEYDEESFIKYSESVSSPHVSTLDDESIRYPKYGNEAVFDDYGSDSDDIVDLVFGSNSKKSLFSRQGEESSVPQVNIDLASPKQHTSGSPSENKSPRLHLFAEREKSPEKTTRFSFPSQSNKNVPARFDDSDGLSSESEDEKVDATHKNAMRPNNVQHNGRSSGRDLLSAESAHGLSNTFFDKGKKIADIVNRSVSPSSSGGNKEKHETISNSAKIFWDKTDSSSSLDNQSSSRIHKAPSNSNDLRGLDDSSSDEEVQPSRALNAKPMNKSEAIKQLPLCVNDQEIPSKLTDESEQGLNYSRLTGGFKQRGITRPPYVRNSAIDDSGPSKQASSGKYPITEKPTVSEIETSSAFLDQELANQELHRKAKAFVSRTSEGSIDSDSMLYDEKLGTETQKKPSSRRPLTYSSLDDDHDSGAKLDSDFTAASKATADIKLSRRTRVMPSDGKSNALRFTGRSKMESKYSETSSIASESHATTAYDAAEIPKKDDSKAIQRNLPAEQSTEAPRRISSAREEIPKLSQTSSTDRVIPANNENTKSQHSSSGSASHESSLKNAPRTHPKLPDYDSLAAHFHSLRSNRN